MAEDTDLATGIAQNIGYMPIVNKIGQAGSGFMDLLGSLLGGRGPASVPAKTKPSRAWDEKMPQDQPGFFGGLWDAILTGAQGTKDAFQSDIQDIQNRRLPREAARAVGDVMGAYGNPAVNPSVPANTVMRRVFDPSTGWSEYVDKAASYPGGNWLELFSRQGNMGPLIEFLQKFVEKNQF